MSLEFWIGILWVSCWSIYALGMKDTPIKPIDYPGETYGVVPGLAMLFLTGTAFVLGLIA